MKTNIREWNVRNRLVDDYRITTHVYRRLHRLQVSESVLPTSVQTVDGFEQSRFPNRNTHTHTNSGRSNKLLSGNRKREIYRFIEKQMRLSGRQRVLDECKHELVWWITGAKLFLFCRLYRGDRFGRFKVRHEKWTVAPTFFPLSSSLRWNKKKTRLKLIVSENVTSVVAYR